MARHLFISYASDDQAVAGEVCALLESRGVSCWIAPRDVAPGAKWDEAIVDAIGDSAAFLLILTHAANESSYVTNEVNQAFGADKPIFTFRVEDVQPNKSLGFYLGRHHWTDGFARPLDGKVDQLAAAVSAIASAADGAVPRPAASTAAAGSTHRAAVKPRMRLPWRGVAIVASALLVGAAAPTAYLRLRAPVTPAAVVRFHVTPPESTVFSQAGGGGSVSWFAISPDGTKLVFAADNAGNRRGGGPLWLRPIDRDVATMLPGTDFAGMPTWSPDGRAIAFLAQGKLKKIDLASGEVVTLADAGLPGGNGGSYYGFSWGSKGQILYSYADVQTNGRPRMFQVAETGGTVTALPLEADTSRAGMWPFFLPDGEHYVYLYGSRERGKSSIAVGTLGSQDHTILESAESNPVFAGGYLLFNRQGTVVAQPFDAGRLRTTGDPVPIAQQVQTDTNSVGAAFTASHSGVFAYHAGASAPTQKLVWVTRAGIEQPITAPVNSYYGPRISPDGHRVAVSVGAVPTTQIWMYDLERSTFSRVTFEGAANIGALWTPDGSRLIYKGTASNMFSQPADGSGAAEPLTKTALSRNNVASSLTTDGQTLLFTYDTATRNIWTLSMKDRTARAWVKTDAYETAPRFSPDGHWIAYDSRESGHDEIYVRPYPGPGGKWQISTNGGAEVVWNPNGRELFYREGPSMMAVDVTTQPAFKAGNPHKLFEGSYLGSPLSNANYDVSSDGQRFLMLKPETGAASAQLNVVVNWVADLKRAAPAK